MSELDPQHRQHLLEQITAWLDELDDAEPAPPGIAPEILHSTTAPAPDLFSLLGQLTALTRETQLQSRATNRLHTELSTKLEALTQSMSNTDALTRKLGEVRRETRLEMMHEVLDIRDRFTRGVEEAQRRLAALRGFWSHFTHRHILQALIDGNLLARERLDEMLRRFGIHEIFCLDQPFDPARMKATEIIYTTTVSPGTVVEVFRPGYTSNGRVLRFAEVKVVAGTPGSKQPAVENDPSQER
jgi:molecular chaperone GrpE (heat shock protein)